VGKLSLLSINIEASHLHSSQQGLLNVLRGQELVTQCYTEAAWLQLYIYTTRLSSLVLASEHGGDTELTLVHMAYKLALSQEPVILPPSVVPTCASLSTMCYIRADELTESVPHDTSRLSRVHLSQPLGQLDRYL
jgi:hypothetical protein